MMRGLPLLLVLLPAFACQGSSTTGPTEERGQDKADAFEPVAPPFSVKGDLDGLLIVWFDGDGLHTAQTRSDVPAEQREHVRVDSLMLPPEQRLDHDFVYVADVRRESSEGYPVYKVARSAFESLVDAVSDSREESRPQAEGAQLTEADVVIYGASWCNACKSAARFFRQRNVAFVEKDIERDSAARSEMQRKVRESGVRATGIPVIDVRGKIIAGFDQRVLAEAL